MVKVRSRTRRIVLLAFLFAVIFFAVSFVYTLLSSRAQVKDLAFGTPLPNKSLEPTRLSPR
jgi:preprotein translocase subunit SecG